MKPCMRSHGIALVSVLLMVAMISSLALLSVRRQQLWIQQLQNRQLLSQAQLAAYAGINFARLTLQDDKNDFDGINESWATPIPAIDIEEGKLSGCLIEMQGKYNLMNLVSDRGTLDHQHIKDSEYLMQQLGVPNDTARKIAKVLVQYKSETINVGSDIPTPSELITLADITQEDWDKIEPFVTLLPERTTVNVNFAKPQVLTVVVQGLLLSQAEQITAKRQLDQFVSLEAFCAMLPDNLKKNSCSSQTLSVKTNYFLAKVETEFNRVHRRYEALLFRQQPGLMPRILWGRWAQPGSLNDCHNH